MDRSVPVKDSMTVNVITAKPKDSVTEIADIMVKNGIGSVVITKGEKPVGIICERDLLDKVISSDLKPSEVTAESVMVTDLITIGPSADMLDAMRRMIDNDIGHLPVIENGKLVGIVTVQDVLEVTPQILEIIPEHAEIESSEESIEESVCEICGEARKPLIQYEDKWICEECRDFLVG